MLLIKGLDEKQRVLMESLVERLFRETYGLEDIPDPRGGTPYPIHPAELLNLSSPLVELVQESGGYPEWFDDDLYAQLQDTPHNHYPGLLAASAPTLSLIAEASQGSELDTPQSFQDSTDPGSGNSDEGIRCVTSKYYD